MTINWHACHATHNTHAYVVCARAKQSPPHCSFVLRICRLMNVPYGNQREKKKIRTNTAPHRIYFGVMKRSKSNQNPTNRNINMNMAWSSVHGWAAKGWRLHPQASKFDLKLFVGCVLHRTHAHTHSHHEKPWKVNVSLPICQAVHTLSCIYSICNKHQSELIDIDICDCTSVDFTFTPLLNIHTIPNTQ